MIWTVDVELTLIYIDEFTLSVTFDPVQQRTEYVMFRGFPTGASDRVMPLEPSVASLSLSVACVACALSPPSTTARPIKLIDSGGRSAVGGVLTSAALAAALTPSQSPRASRRPDDATNQPAD